MDTPIIKHRTVTEEPVRDKVRFCAEVMASPKVILAQIEEYEDGTQAVMVRVYLSKYKHKL